MLKFLNSFQLPALRLWFRTCRRQSCQRRMQKQARHCVSTQAASRLLTSFHRLRHRFHLKGNARALTLLALQAISFKAVASARKS
jgi:hypothetical protein